MKIKPETYQRLGHVKSLLRLIVVASNKKKLLYYAIFCEKYNLPWTIKNKSWDFLVSLPPSLPPSLPAQPLLFLNFSVHQFILKSIL